MKMAIHALKGQETKYMPLLIYLVNTLTGCLT